MNKEDIYQKVHDITIPYHELPNNIHIEDFVGGFDIIDKKQKKITYGVNVYLGEETDNSVTPFNYNNSGFKAQEIAEKVTRGYTIPDFLNKFNIKEISFRVDFIKEKGIITINKIEVKPLFGKNPLITNDYNDISILSDEIKKDFFDKDPHTFLHENILALFPSYYYSILAGQANVWVRGEDPDITTGKFLEHYLVISDDSNRFQDFINNTRMNFMEFVIMLKTRKLYDAYVLQRKEAIKSAKAAIMSRNMSHNLGSHVMSYLKTNLSSVKSILKDNVLSFLLKDEELNPALFSAQQFNTNKLTLPFLVGIGRFISYLQERQDYIATVSTDYIPYYSSVNFKDFIYDELNSDKRYERHPDRTNLKPDNILLGNIARSEGLGRQTSPTKENDQTLSNIVLKFRTRFDGTVPEDDKVAQAELDQMRNYELSLPGGIVGRQAIFSIIENVIRNAAKHGNWRAQGQLELTLDIFTKEDVENKQPDDELKKRLPDNDQADEQSLSLKGVLERFYNGEASNDYFIITLTDNLASDPKPLKELRKALHEDYVNSDNHMIETNKGIKEMRISAAWLRSLDNDLELSPFNESNDGKGENEWSNAESNWNKQPPVLYIRLSKGVHNQCHLQYIFCVMRPKKVAFISSAFNKQNLKIKSYNGYFFLSPDEYLRLPNKNFEFVVYNDEMRNAKERDMIEKKRKIEEKKTDLNKHLFKLAKNKFEEEKTLLEEARCRSSHRFFILSELLKEGFIAKEDINELVSSINIIKNGQEDDVKKKIEYFKKKTKEIYLHLYQHLSKWNQKERIFIDDYKARLNCKPSEISKYIAFLSRDVDDTTSYRYITHLEDKKQFLEYVINLDPDQKLYYFSEGISGDNSTDRLVRNEPKTELWFYKHLHAMKQKVAIFDERIFAKVTGLDESDIQHFRSSSNSRNIDEDKAYIKKIITDKLDLQILDLVKTREELNKFIKDREKKYKIDLPKAANSDCYDLRTKNHLGATFKYKNLHIFSFIQSAEDSKRFNLYGIQIDANKPFFSECIRYASLSWDSENKRLRIENNSQYQTDWMQFHSLSIHQGLLDKLYAAFKIDKTDINIELKENLTKDFYEHFIIDACDREIEFRDSNNMQRYFLPGMTIHSGRSKPSKEDMPQHLPFIPYSALEHAVLDCKYSIVELLDSARYE